MASIEHVATLMNIHGLMPGPMASFGGGKPFDALEVWGALGLSKISREAQQMGLMIYCSSERDRLEALKATVRRADQLFEDNEWDGTTPFRRQLNTLHSEGALKASYEETMRVVVFSFKVSLATLVIKEIRQDGNCHYCGGTGVRVSEEPPITVKKCARCVGVGKLSMPEHVKYESICVRVPTIDGPQPLNFSRHAWGKTWCRRYDMLFTDVRAWLSEFNELILKHFE